MNLISNRRRKNVIGQPLSLSYIDHNMLSTRYFSTLSGQKYARRISCAFADFHLESNLLLFCFFFFARACELGYNTQHSPVCNINNLAYYLHAKKKKNHPTRFLHYVRRTIICVVFLCIYILLYFIAPTYYTSADTLRPNTTGP